MTLDNEARADYRDVFGADPEPWRDPLGALRLTLAGDAPWTLERARHECEELVRVLNEPHPTTEKDTALIRSIDNWTPALVRKYEESAFNYMLELVDALETARGVRS